MTIAVAVGFSMTSCSDDETSLSRVVLSSVSVLEFDGQNPQPQIITVTSDGDWVAETNDWVTVSPSTGTAGQTEVEITPLPNFRDNLLDNPRRSNVLFKGRNLESIATVLIKQGGDLYRDPVDYTIDQLNEIEDETVVKLLNLQVVANSARGFVATDGASFTYVVEPGQAVAIGDKYDVVGQKFSDASKMVYVQCGKLTSKGNSNVTEQTPFDITETLDAITGNVYKYVTVTGVFNGSGFTVNGMNNVVNLLDKSESLPNVDDLLGHIVKITGYYAGCIAPTVNIIPVSLEDLGLNLVKVFEDDFEWMDPWSELAGVKDVIAMGAVNEVAQSTNISAVNADGKRLIDELYDRGYNFVKATYEGKEDRPFETRIYFQRNYLKFSLTGIEAGVVLPSIPDVNDGDNVSLMFDWSPMIQGSAGATNRAFDPITLVVIVNNDGTEEQFPVPPHTLVKGGEHLWMNANINIGNKINANTKITIRSSDDRWPVSTVNRFFFDNVKVFKEKK